MKVLICGNSVPLRVRPAVMHEQDACYGMVLKNALADIDIEIKAQGAATITDVLEKTDELLSAQAQVYVLNYGIVDMCTRPVSRKLYNWLFKPGKPSFIKNLMRGAESRFRPQMVKLRGKRSWVSHNDYMAALDMVIKSIQKDIKTKFLILGINDCNTRIEQQLPGSLNNIRKLNDLIRSYCRNQDAVEFVDPNTLSPSLQIPDGIHYSAKDHARIANQLKQAIYG